MTMTNLQIMINDHFFNINNHNQNKANNNKKENQLVTSITQSIYKTYIKIIIINIKIKNKICQNTQEWNKPIIIIIKNI